MSPSRAHSNFIWVSNIGTILVLFVSIRLFGERYEFISAPAILCHRQRSEHIPQADEDLGVAGAFSADVAGKLEAVVAAAGQEADVLRQACLDGMVP